VGGDPFYVKFWVKQPPLERNRPPLEDLGATYDDHLRLIGKRVVNFLLALIELFSLGVTAEGASKTQNVRFSLKNALRLKKVCYKVSLCENCQQQSCKAFIGLTKCTKIIGGGRPLVPEILDQSDCVGAKSPIFDLFRP